MSKNSKLCVRMENFRTFKSEQTIEIKPLTFLVGENSSGKSTALAAISLVLNRDNFPFGASFNKSPFELGSYSSIASKHGARISSFFSLGYSLSGDTGTDISLKANFGSSDGQPVMTSMTLQDRKFQFSFSTDTDTGKIMGVFSNLTSGKEYKFEDTKYLNSANADVLGRSIESFMSFTYHLISQSAKDKKADTLPSDFYELFSRAIYLKPTCLALAPVRSKPRRTYDVFDLDFQPEGDHVPYVLSSVFNDQKKGTTQAKKISNLLSKFGTESALFEKLSVKKLGKGKDSAFNILVKSKKSSAVNITDVGYGVSQSLPVVIEPTRSGAQVILIQQPEVHLHPKAQAALGDVYVDTVVGENKSLVIETHSDFLIDRVRAHIGQKRIAADKVQILYFKKVGEVSEVHTIKFDNNGNTIHSPDGYRDFFVKEQMSLLDL